MLVGHVNRGDEVGAGGRAGAAVVVVVVVETRWNANIDYIDSPLSSTTSLLCAVLVAALAAAKPTTR